MAGLFGWGAPKAPEPAEADVLVESTATSVVLPKFISALSSRASPTLLDLGPVVGATVSFLGSRLGCRLLVGDLHADIEGARGARPDVLRDKLLERLGATVTLPLDGILCWDVFDFLDRPTSQAVAAWLTGRLTPGGVIHGMFGTTPATLTQRTRFAIRDASTLVCRPEPTPPLKRAVLTTRDLAAMFAGLTVVESVLLKAQRRETLLKRG